MANERQNTQELEQKISIVDQWIKNLAEHHAADSINKGVLREVLELYGAKFELDEDKKKLLGREHYSSSKRRGVVADIWGERYQEFIDFSNRFIEGIESTGEEVSKLSKSKLKHIAFTSFIEEMTAYAGTSEEEYSEADFVSRMTARTFNGFVTYELGSKKKEHRMHIVVPGYNNVVYEFDGQEGDTREGEMPFAPASLHPDFIAPAWENIKSWKSDLSH